MPMPYLALGIDQSDLLQTHFPLILPCRMVQETTGTYLL